jgi:dCMP deaminase
MNWDRYYLEICEAVALNSKCFSRHIGAIIVRDKVVICTGYNGPPRGFPHCKDSCPRRRLGYDSGQGLHLCPAAHAERNAIDQAARLGIATAGATIYMNCPVPCKDCLITLIQAGIEEVVCTDTGQLYDYMSGKLMQYINVRSFDL